VFRIQVSSFGVSQTAPLHHFGGKAATLQ